MSNRFARTIRSILALFRSKLKGPMATGEKFVVLDENYLDQFDEVVVIGDIHGCYEEFKELLKEVHDRTPSKRPEKCLKILVGDLVNKGPANEKVLRACRDKYYNSILGVRGNHDEIVLAQYKKFKESGKKLAEDNKWIEKLSARYISYLNLLPYSISIPSLKCIIVHGGLDPSKEEPAKNTPIDIMTTMRNIEVLKNNRTGETSYNCTKSSEVGIAWATFWPGPEHVYFGHDARRRLQDDHEFATGLDTGCVYGDRLTYVYIKGPKKGQVLSVKAKKAYQPTEDP